MITLHTQSCSPLRLNRCQSVSGRARLDNQVTRTADSSLIVIEYEMVKSELAAERKVLTT